MKKTLRVLMTLALSFFVAFLGNAMNVKAEGDVNIVYAQVPTDWENPCVWTWDADGNSAFEAWPGEEMLADANNEGWYYLYIPASMTNVIINANEGSVQTADLATNSDNAWVTVASAEEAALSNEQATTGDLPEYVEQFTMYAKVDASWEAPHAWAWSAPDGTNAFEAWPGEEMSANTDGFYSIKLPTWVNSVIVNANEGSVQTADIAVEAKDLWLVVDAAGEYELSYEKPAAGADELITVHAIAPEDWLLPSLWAWSAPDGTNVFANWPGQELTLNGDWYEYQIPNWVNSIIINGNLGEVQTTDISIETGKDVWVVVTGPEEYTVTYEEPDLTAVEAPAKEAPAAEEAAPVEEVKSGAPVGLIVGIVAAVVVIAGVIVGIVLGKKKKN